MAAPPSRGAGRGTRPPTKPRQTQPTFKLQLRLLDPRRKPTRAEIFSTTFTKLNAPLTKLFDAKNGFYAASDNETTIDNLLTKKARDALRSINLEPVLPPEVRARRTVFIRQIDHHVGNQTAETIKTEIETINRGIKLTDVIKIKDYTHVIKLVCEDTATADKIIQHGILAFSTKITAAQCERETFTHIQICFKCYKYEDHATNDCKQTFDICSECAQRGHTHLTCINTNKKCINCPDDETNDHRTLAAKCPHRKKTIADKEQKKTTAQTLTQNTTYANIAKAAIKEQTTETRPNVIKLTNKTQLKMTALILEAHIASLTEPKSYSQILSDSLKLNFDIDAKFPDRNSRKIFNLYAGGDDVRDMLTDTDSDMDQGGYEDDDDYRRSSFDLTNETSDDEPQTTGAKPKVLTKPTKRKATEPAQPDTDLGHKLGQKLMDAINPTRIGLKLYRSTLDKTRIPEHITPHYLHTEINKTDFGLKIEAENTNTKTIRRLLSEGTLRVSRQHIHLISHDSFTKLPREQIRPTSTAPK